MIALTTNMAALKRGCKPRVRAIKQDHFTALLYLGIGQFGSIKIQS